MKSNQFVLITGASETTGYALARLFAADGFNLVLVAKSSKALALMTRDLTQEYKIDIIPIAKDLSAYENVVELYKEASTTGIIIETLVNNAGEELYGATADAYINRELEILRLSIESMVALTRLFFTDMMGRGNGKILNVAAINGQVPETLQSVYRASAAFTNAFTEGLRDEVKSGAIIIKSLLPNNKYAGDLIKDAYTGLMSR